MTARPDRARPAWLVAAGLLALGAGLSAWMAAQAGPSDGAGPATPADLAARSRGAALFDGRAPLPGRLNGHAAALPAVATRCTNCHAGGTVLGGLLGADRLARPQSRRGGPPSRFDAAALCQLLRTGQDPAHVIIDGNMPRYDVSDAQCGDLWAHLLALR